MITQWGKGRGRTEMKDRRETSETIQQKLSSFYYGTKHTRGSQCTLVEMDSSPSQKLPSDADDREQLISRQWGVYNSGRHCWNEAPESFRAWFHGREVLTLSQGGNNWRRDSGKTSDLTADVRAAVQGGWCVPATCWGPSTELSRLASKFLFKCKRDNAKHSSQKMMGEWRSWAGSE